jgi:hypothetical protein
MHVPRLVVAALATLPLLPAVLAAQVTVGQQDTFEGVTTQGWVVGGAPDVVHPTPPTVIPSGGPGGVGDGFLRLQSNGLEGPGGRLSAYNVTQWMGDYRAAGIGAIAFDARNAGNSDIFLRLLWVDFPDVPGPPQNGAVSQGFLLRAGSDWQRYVFDIGPGAISALFGNAELALRNADELRFFHNPAPVFGGPPNSSPLLAATLDLDNITAVAVVPEPSSVLLVGTGALLLPLLRRRRQRS